MKELNEYLKKINDLSYTANLLMWELRINAPVYSQNDLINLITKYESEMFELQTSEKYGKLLKSVLDSEELATLDQEEALVIKKAYDKFLKNKRIPKDFYEKYVELTNTVNVVWKNAKEKNNYEMFKPELAKMIEATKQFYRYLEPDAKNLYDVMLNEYEAGMTSKEIDKLFNELKEGIMPLIPNSKRKVKVFTKEYTKEELINNASFLLDYIGFDLNKGSLGIYPHGYTEKMNPNDVRIAFKHSNTPLNYMMTIIHEGGHGIFEQSIKPCVVKYDGGSLENLYGLHESQSRFFENFLGRRKSFWIPIYDQVKENLHLKMDLDTFVKGLNTPVCGLIRTDADELTYCMHIIVRYEIERDLFNDKISIDELPKIWNEKMKEYLHIVPENDRDGLMQDVHWSEGGFGYFPSYLLGSIYDGMLMEAIKRDLGDVDKLLENGEIKKITKYLQENIYINGGAYNSKEILEKLYKKEISAKPLIEHFKEKYSKE